MPDISMCKNIFCPSNSTCHRFTAIPNSYQTYADFVVPEGEDRCSYYWNDEGYNKRVGDEINKED